MPAADNPRDIAQAAPNRADLLGIFKDSPIFDEQNKSYWKRRYAAALQSLVQRLLLRAEASGLPARGKRRMRTRPQDRSNTIHVYLKALEQWHYYCIGKWGRELEPKEISTDVAMEYAAWMHGDAKGPDIRPLHVRNYGKDYGSAYDAVAKACSQHGQANITQIIEALPPEERDRLIRMPSDPRFPADLKTLHTLLGKIVRSFRSIVRIPSPHTIRQQEGTAWSARERDPYTYSYAIASLKKLAIGSVVTHLSSLSAVWGELSKPLSATDPPLAFNPWSRVYADWNWRLQKERENVKASGFNRGLTHPIVFAMFNTAVGDKIEDCRNMLMLRLFTYLGLRAEEVCGLQRQDIRELNGVVTLFAMGKGNKVRALPVFSEIKEAWLALNDTLTEMSQRTAKDESGQASPTYEAAYAASLMADEAPMIPSLVRWGCNQKDRIPGADAKEPLDTSGIRAIFAKLADRARVQELATGIVRPLSVCDKGCEKKPCNHERKRVHPHAFRHYAATAATLAGNSLTDVKEMLGHTAIRTTEGYIAVSPQKSMAFSAGIYRVMHGKIPLTPEELGSMKMKGLSPLDEPNLIASMPEEKEKKSAGPAGARTPAAEPPDMRSVASPLWAYTDGDEMLAYLPGVPARLFSAEVKRREVTAMQAVSEARGKSDLVAFEKATAELLDSQAKHMWITFRCGKISRLPWWAGRANQWKGQQLAPIMSYAQIAPENGADAYVIEEIRAYYDQLVETSGPTAGAALIAWLSEMIDTAAVQFARAMDARRDGWIPFDAEATTNAKVVREHHPESILAWFEDYGGAYRATGYKSMRNRGNVAIVAMDELPQWMWSPDPVAELPEAERVRLRQWVLCLQGARPSKIRMDQWLDQMAVRILQWADRAKTYQEKTGTEWSWEDRGSDESGRYLALEAKAIAKEIKGRFRALKKQLDVRLLLSGIQDPTEEIVRHALSAALKSEGVDLDSQVGAVLTPGLPARAGARHVLDPALLTWDGHKTIVHTEEVRRYWFEKYGTDSECLTRRAVRGLWERRKKALYSQSTGLIARHFDMWLSTVVPCTKDIEQRIREAGWKAPHSVSDVAKVGAVMWGALADRIRKQHGAPAATEVPDEITDKFWSKELPVMQRFVEEYSPDVTTVRDESASTEKIIRQAGQEAQITSEGLFGAESEKPEPDDDLQPNIDFATAVSKTATPDPRGYALERKAFWGLARTDTKYVALGSEQGAGIFKTETLRTIETSLKGLRPSIFWDPEGRKLKFVWQKGKGTLSLLPVSADSVSQNATITEAWIPGTDKHEAPAAKWTDDRSWSPRWVEYPQPTPSDFDNPFVKSFAWPNATGSSARLLQAAQFEHSMRRYAKWKRSQIRANPENVPDGWTQPTTGQQGSTTPLPHPVDLAFAAIRTV